MASGLRTGKVPNVTKINIMPICAAIKKMLKVKKTLAFFKSYL